MSHVIGGSPVPPKVDIFFWKGNVGLLHPVLLTVTVWVEWYYQILRVTMCNIGKICKGNLAIGIIWVK